MPPVLFYDVDGVLNRANRPDDVVNMFAVESLAAILKQTGGVAVMTSTWRNDLAGRSPADVFDWASFLPHHADPATPFLPALTRGDEVLAWLRQHPGVTRYAVLDDLPVRTTLRSHPPAAELQLARRTMLVDGKKGFGTPDHVNTLLAMLSAS